MIRGEPPTDAAMAERCPRPHDHTAVDPPIWYAIAGGSLTHLPRVGSTVVYFPQGHVEQSAASGDIDLDRLPRNIPPVIFCKVLRVDFLADSETDGVFARLLCRPLAAAGHAVASLSASDEADRQVEEEEEASIHPEPQQPPSFAKTLTQSDANNGGGFSIPRFCAENIFPRLDYSKDPPVQSVIAKDVHGVVWQFRHIYRGTPRRHLLSTGWSNFVNKKKLVAGDVVVFLRSDPAEEISVGIRRCGGKVSARALTQRCQSGNLRLDRSAGGHGPQMAMAGQGSSCTCAGDGGLRKALEAAASGEPFEMVYYPSFSIGNASFCVKASAVKAAMECAWVPGMRVKMAVETEDSSRTSWYLGTVLRVQEVDPVRWPGSPWKMLQVSWDEAALRNAGRVSPWQVEPVSTSTQLNLPLLLSMGSRKKARHSAQETLVDEEEEEEDDDAAAADGRTLQQLRRRSHDPGGTSIGASASSDGVRERVVAAAWREPGSSSSRRDGDGNMMQVARFGDEGNKRGMRSSRNDIGTSKEVEKEEGVTEGGEERSGRYGDGGSEEGGVVGKGRRKGSTQFRLFGTVVEAGD